MIKEIQKTKCVSLNFTRTLFLALNISLVWDLANENMIKWLRGCVDGCGGGMPVTTIVQQTENKTSFDRRRLMSE